MAMTKKDQDALAAAGKAWTEANARGDKAGMDAAHKQAESIRNSYGYSGGSDGSQHITGNSADSKKFSSSGGNKTGGQYVGVGAGDQYNRNQVGMTAADQAELSKWGAAYNSAATQEEKDYAHKMAEEIRAKYQYSGGDDGSEYLPFMNQYGTFPYPQPPQYTDQYSSRIDEMLDKLLNRDKFSYDNTKDPLWQQYQSQYLREGERAMEDTLGQLSARTGGLSSSWAQTAGQQAQNYYASQAADKIPELYQLAYNMYLKDIDTQIQDLGLLNDMSDRQYNRYRDTMSDWMNDRNFAYGVYRDDISDDRYKNEWNYNVNRDQISDNRYENETAYNRALQLLQAGIMPGSDVLTQAGLTASQAAGILANRTKSSGGSGGRRVSPSGGGGGGQDYAGLYKAAQESGYPKSFISNNYKKYGFTSATGLYDGYQSWESGDGEESTGDDTDFKTRVLNNMKDVVSKNGGLNSAQISQLKNYVAGHMLTEDEVNEILDTLGYGG